jgi:hypothetical protein
VISDSSEASEQPQVIIFVGQDCDGHWLVQDSAKRLEGRFISLAAAKQYAHAERQIYHAEIEFTSRTMVPLISFLPPASKERSLSLAA